ncbi:MAG: 30S ribosomal protein S4 [Bacteroidota bacterium]
MARYKGPKSKVSRRYKENLFGHIDKALEKKNYPPGQHGPNKKRMKQSEYATQLYEKQKAKFIYGILERQFENLFVTASHLKGITGHNLLALCESRLDNTVYRLGIAKSRRAARQLVSHRHITVNGQVVNVPSFQLKPGDTISVRERSKSMEAIANAIGSNSKKFDWLAWDGAEMKGTFINKPEREQIPENIKESLIVELYSK